MAVMASITVIDSSEFRGGISEFPGNRRVTATSIEVSGLYVVRKIDAGQSVPKLWFAPATCKTNKGGIR